MTGRPVAGRLRALARRLRLELDALAVVRRDPRVPRAARVLITVAVAYALSPIDLIPDAIPVLGLVDDLLIVPLALWLALRLVPDGVLVQARANARRQPTAAGALPRLGLALTVGTWAFVVAAVWWAVR